ncbi:MAG: phosphonate ABC transporter, permease protein PhnE [Candidatus Omnitrophica bacterium]|nr:phosphonate ABC transporter, permease protein PhnE [Candidatus Omnitrophota bacterium]
MQSSLIKKEERSKQWVWIVVIAGILIWSWRGSEMSLVHLFGGTKNIFIYLKDYFPPDFSRVGLYLKESIVCLHIAIWGTIIAAILSLPLGLLAARNIVGNLIIHQLVRRFLDLLRAINEFIFALIFVCAVGLGPFAGLLAIAVHTTGVLGKLISEVIESIDPGQVEAITSTGANKLQIIAFSVLPQIMPLWVSNVLYRFEVSVRSSTIIGLCGAGGIGFLLWEAMRSFKSKEVCAMLIIIVVMVGIIDLVCSKIRKKMI